MEIFQDEQGCYVCGYSREEVESLLVIGTGDCSNLVNDAFSNVIQNYPEIVSSEMGILGLVARLYEKDDGGALVRFEENNRETSSLFSKFGTDTTDLDRIPSDIIEDILSRIAESVEELYPYNNTPYPNQRMNKEIPNNTLVIKLDNMDSMMEYGDFLLKMCRYKVNDILYEYKKTLYWVLTVEKSNMKNLMLLLSELVGVNIDYRRHLSFFLQEHSTEFKLCSGYLNRA